MKTPQQKAVEIGLWILGVIIILAAIFFGGKYVLDLREAAKANAETAREQETTANDAGEISGNLTEAQAEQAKVEVVITDARRAYAQAVAADPSLADWRAQPIPDRMRELARARRAARGGPGDNPAGSGPDDPASVRSGRDPAP